MKRFLICLLLLTLCLPGLAQAVSFDITENEMNVTIEPDGTGLIEERLVYSFDDDYNGILVTIRHAGVTLADVSVSSGGIDFTQVDATDSTANTFALTTEGDSTEVRAYSPGGKGQRVFSLSYRLEGIATRYLDTARINHVFFKSDTTLPRATLRVVFPGYSAAEAVPYVHGVSKAMTLDGSALTLGPVKLGSGDPLELDILFPAEWLPDAPVVQEEIREEVVALETALANDIQRQARTLTIALLSALGVYLLVGFLVFFRMRGSYGLKHAILPTTDEAMLRDIPAAEAQVLKEGSVSASGLSATLISLADKGILSAESEGGDVRFTLVRRPEEAIEPHEAYLLDWLFATRDSLTVEELDAGDSQEGAAEFTNRYNEWKAQVVRDMREKGWIFGNDGARWGAIIAVLVVGLALSGFLLRVGLWPLAILGAVLSALFALLYSRLRRLTDAGEARLAAILGFCENYVDRLETDPQAILGHTPLVMALGYLAPLAEWIDAHPGEDSGVAWDALPAYWAYSGWHHSMIRMDDTVRDVQSHNAGTANGGGDSSSSGGGFSGGSGGGNSYGAF